MFGTIFEAVTEAQSRPSTKKRRGLGKRTRMLMGAILAAFEEVEPPVTVRQMFYMMSVRGAAPKTEAGYRQPQRVLLMMRRAGIPYDHIADNIRWMRKPTTCDNLEDFFKRSARFYRQNLWITSD